MAMSATPVMSQSDSLLRFYLNKKNPDTLRWKALLSFAFDLQYADPDSSIKLSKLVLNESEKWPSARFRIRALINIASALGTKDDNKGAAQLFDSAASLQLRSGLTEQIGSTYCNMALVYRNMTNYPKCEYYMRKALDEAERTHNSHLLTMVYDRYSNYYYDLSNYPKAIEYAFMELRAFEKNEKEDPSGVLINIGIYYGENGNDAKSAEYLKTGLETAKKFGNKLFAANAIYNLASAAIDKNTNDRALIDGYLSEGLKLFEDIDSPSGMAGIYLLKGSWKVRLKNYAEARKDLEHSIAMYHKLSEPLEESSAYLQLGEVCLAEKNMNAALGAMHRGLELAKVSRSHKGIADALSKLYITYKQAGKKNEALGYYEEFVALKDSMFNDGNRRSIMKNELRYEYEKEALRDSIANAAKIKEERLINEQAIRQQQIYTYTGLGGFALMLVIAGISFRAFRNKQKANIIIMEQKKLVEIQKQMVEEKQREVLDSIKYAQRIQKALITNEKYIEKTLKKLRDS